MDRSEKLVRSFASYVKGAACLVILGGILVLIGWATNNEQFICLFPSLNGDVLPFLGRLHSTSAICLLLCSIALLLSLVPGRAFGIAATVVSALTAVSALPALYVAFTREDFEPIRVFQPDPAATGITFPVPMAAEVAASIILLSVSILLLRLPFKQSVRFAQITSAVSTAIPLLILLGAATKVPQICALGGCFTMSTGFAVLALLLSSAIFLSRPDTALASMFASSTMGGALLRRGTLFFFIVPFLLIARTVIVHSQLDIDEQTSWLLFLFCLLVSMIGLIISGVQAVNRIEVERTKIAGELAAALDKHDQIANALAETKEELERTRQSKSSVTNQSTTADDTPRRYKRVCLTCANEFEDSVEVCPDDGSTLNRILDDSMIGSVFAEKYKVKALLGEGGMSTVFKATHIFVNRDVAIKVLKGHATASKESLKRFMREARTMGSLDHPGIVAVSDFGLAPDGRAYLVMDYLEGMSLSEVLEKTGPLRRTAFNDVVMQICEALSFAHQQGVIHRDLKPSNVMLNRKSNGQTQIKVVDFGLAKFLEEESEDQKLTQTGECFGSPLYMAPEQCTGRKADERTDIYALGCIFFECLTGYQPIMGRTAADTMQRHLREKPEAFPEGSQVDMQVRTAIYRALEKKPEARQQTVAELMKELLTLNESRGNNSSGTTPSRTLAQISKFNKERNAQTNKD